MFTHFNLPVLFAEGNRARQAMQAFRSVGNDDAVNRQWLILIVALACLLTFVLLAIIGHRYGRRWAISSPRGLFLELCRAHRLNWPQRRLLWRLAQSQKPADPAGLFLAPERFEIGRLTVEMRPRVKELHELCRRLFAESGPEPSERPAISRIEFDAPG
ncbi:MAG: hypothetical protein IT426_11380 [Pirellulales bacterium]|nr:hypothetical protein [Pirellulales bacterium]